MEDSKIDMAVVDVKAQYPNDSRRKNGGEQLTKVSLSKLRTLMGFGWRLPEHWIRTSGVLPHVLSPEDA